MIKKRSDKEQGEVEMMRKKRGEMKTQKKKRVWSQWGGGKDGGDERREDKEEGSEIGEKEDKSGSVCSDHVIFDLSDVTALPGAAAAPGMPVAPASGRLHI